MGRKSEVWARKSDKCVGAINSGCTRLGSWVGICVVALGIGCSSAPEVDSVEVAPVEQKVDGGGDEVRDEKEGDEVDNDSDDEASRRGQHFWGGIQERADGAYDELEVEIEECLAELDDSDRVREIGLRARREGMGGYVLEGIVTGPEEGVDEPCVEEVAERYVEAVGASLWDDYDTYIATFIARPEPGGQCDEFWQDAVCVGLDAEIDDGQGRENGECDQAIVDAINSAARESRHCVRPQRYDEHMRNFEGDPLWLRAVIFGDVFVEKGEVSVILYFNQPWVEEMARCMADEVAELELETAVDGSECRSTLRNRALTYSMEPVFTYLVGE